MDTDDDGLTDVEELKSTVPTAILDINEYIKVLKKEHSVSYEFHYPAAYAYEYNSDPSMKDTDNDKIEDCDEKEIGTSPLQKDTDKDGLSDGVECISWYDPLNKNPDGDKYNDAKEYKEGTDPFYYNKTAKENANEFLEGVVKGDFIKDPSVPAVCGQIVGSMVPLITDARDVIANAMKGNWNFAALSAVGIIPAAGDVAKASGKVGKFIAKNLDDADVLVEFTIKIADNFPDQYAKLIPKKNLDDIAKIFESENKLSKEQYKKFVQILGKCGKKVKTIANEYPNAKVVKMSEDIWSKPWITRGNIIDAKFNNLGHNYPVYDHFDKDLKIATSVKSLDFMCPSYKKASKLKSRLNRYGRQLMRGKSEILFNEKNFEIKKRVLKLAVPDMPLTKAQKQVIDDFIKDNAKNFDVEITIFK